MKNDKNMLTHDLISIGFTLQEAKVYIATLELGTAPVSRIAQKAGFRRSNTYTILRKLCGKGLLTQDPTRGVARFFVENPQKITNLLEENLKKAQRLVPELSALANAFEHKPKIYYYSGKEAMREIHMDTLNYPKMEYVSWISDLVFYQNYDSAFWYDYYMPERIAKKISVRAILPSGKDTEAFQGEDGKFLRQSRLDSSKDYKIETVILLYGNNKIGIISTDEMFGLIIESKRLYRSLKGIFEIHWRSLEKKAQ